MLSVTIKYILLNGVTVSHAKTLRVSNALAYVCFVSIS